MTPVPAPLAGYAQRFDALFGKRNQRESLRQYLEALLVPAGPDTRRRQVITLIALVNAEPIAGVQRP